MPRSQWIRMSFGGIIESTGYDKEKARTIFKLKLQRIFNESLKL